MRAEILCVGTELLLGDIVNTNAQYLARELANMGIGVYYQSVVGDNPERLKNAYELAFNRADIVITTGGLGPTKDDLTKEIAAQFFERELVLHEPSLIEIEEYFKRSNREMTESNKKQAYFPKDAFILKNNHGTAPGCIVEGNGKVIVLLPGPPREMKPMFDEGVIPYINKYVDGVLESKVLRVIGIGESKAEDMLKDLIENQSNPTIAPYAKFGEVTFRITAKADNRDKALQLIEPIEKEIRDRFKENIYGINDDNLESVIGKMLVDKKLTISCAESCTGGIVAAKLINYPGISEVFTEGAVTYSNEAKKRRLGVKEDTLRNFGAVSSETAAEMAEGIAKAAGTNIGLSTTGVAGPGGGTDEKPVGLVYIALYIDGEVKTKKLNIKGDREKVRTRTAITLIDWLRRELLNR